ncbi:MAG: 4Fe-4S dicluster domain-containing protein [Promethearchaeota archaeon]
MDLGKNYKAEPKTGLPPVESILKAMLDAGIVQQVLGTSFKKSVTQLSPATIDKPDDIKDMHLNSYVAFDFARTDSASKYIHQKMGGAYDKKTGAFGRPCDIRALIELHKRKQVNLENVIMIGIEEFGRLDPKLMRKFYKAQGLDQNAVIDTWVSRDKVTFKLNSGEEKAFTLDSSINFCRNCLNCTRKGLENIDIKASFLSDKDGIIITPMTERGLEILEKAENLISFTPTDFDSAFLIKELEEKAKESQLRDINEFRAKPVDEKMAILGKCTMCGMCIRACPVCFCVDCVLQKKRKEKKIDQYTYQLTRISHIADTCIQCGRCDSVCPSNLPLNVYFNDVAMKLAEKFNYQAGYSLDDKPPRSNIDDLQMRFKVH